MTLAPNVMTKDLPGLSLNEFTLNHFTTYPKSNLRLCNISPKIFIVSSAKLHNQILGKRKGYRF